MSFWPFRKINEHKNCVVNTKSKFQDSKNGNSKENVFESKQPEANENNCTEEYLDFPMSYGIMERLKGGHYLKDVSHGENDEGGKLKLAMPKKNQTNTNQTNQKLNPQELKRTLQELELHTNTLYRSFSKAYKSQDSCSNSIKFLEQKSKFCFESSTGQQFFGRIDQGDTYPLDVYYVEVPPNEQAFKLEDKREPKEGIEENSSSLVETNVSKKQENRINRSERKTSSAKCTEKRFSNNSPGDVNTEGRQTCQHIKFCCKPLDCTQPRLYRCTLSKEVPSCSNKADKCKELKDRLKLVKDNQQCDQQTCKPSKYCCERVDFKQDCCCECKKPIIYRCTPYPSDPPCTEKSKVCKELEDYLKSTKNVKRECSNNNREERVSQSGQSMNGRSSLRKSNEYKGTANETSSAKEPYNNSKGNGNERTFQTQRASESLNNQNGRFSLRKQDDYLKDVKDEIPKEYSNNSQRNSSLRASETQRPDKSMDLQNGRPSLRQSGEYKQLNHYLKGVEYEAPIESSNNSQRDSSGRASQSQPPVKSLDLQNGRSSLRKSNGFKMEYEIAPPENIQRGSSNNSQGDARISPTSQSFKTFDRKEDLEDTKRGVSEDVSKICQPIKFFCKRLDCTQYPPCMIKPKGYKQPAVFSCRLCSPKENTSCLDRSSVCKELEDYLQSIRKKKKEESSDNNQKDQPKEVFDSKADRSSLRKSNEYKQEDNDLENEILPNENMPEDYFSNSRGDARAFQTQWPSRSLNNQNARSSLRKSLLDKQREDANGRASQNYQPFESLDSKEGRSSLRKSNEYKQQVDASGRSSIKNVSNNQGNANGRVSQSYQPVEATDSRDGRSSLRKSKEYKHQNNYIKTEIENIQYSKGSQGDSRVSQTSRAFKDFNHKEDACSPREEIAPDNNVSEQVLGASQTNKYCCEPVDLTKCQPCLMKTNGGKPPRVYRCWNYDSNQDSKACSGKSNECKQPVIFCSTPSSKKYKAFECETLCDDQSCLLKIKICKIPAECCCKPCQPKPDPCCSKKSNKCKEPFKYRSRPVGSKEDPLDLLKTQVIKQLIDYLKDLKVQLTSAKMMHKELCNTNKSDVSQTGSHTCPGNRSSQVKRISHKDSPNLVQNNGRKQNENDLKGLKEMPSELCDARQQEKIKEVTSPTKSSDLGQEVLSNGAQKETPHLPATLMQKISSDTVQPSVLVCCKRKKGGGTPSKKSADSCKCQDGRKLNVPGSTHTNVHKPRDNLKDIKDIKEEIPRARASQNSAINGNKLDSRTRKEDSPISKNMLSGRPDSSEKSSQTEQPINMQSAKVPHKHTLNVAPITLTIPLKLVINSQECQSNIIETDIIFEATSGAQRQGSSMAVPKTTMPINSTIYIPDSNGSDGFFSCLSDSGDVEVERLPFVKPQLKSSMAHTKTPDSNGSDGFFSCLSGSGVMEVERLGTVSKTHLNKTTHVEDDSDSDVFFPCLSESDIMVAEAAATVKPQYIVELEQQVNENTNSCTIIPTTVPPVSKSVNQQTKTESEKPLKIPATLEPVPEVKLVEEQTLQTPFNVMHISLPAYVEPKSSRYSTPIDYQGIPANISKRGRTQSKSAEPAVADKATTTSYISGRQLRNEMRMEIQEQLKELLELKDTNAKHKYDAQERDTILLELHKLFNPEMVDLLPQDISKEITLTSIRYIVEPELLSNYDNEITKLSEHQARILEDMRHLINPKSVQSDGARKFPKETKFKILENLRIILNSRKQERSSDADIRKNVLNDLRSLLDEGEVNKSYELEQGPSTSQEKDKNCQQQSPNDIKDATPNLEAENMENQGNAVKMESLSTNSSEEMLIDSNRSFITRKVQAAPPIRIFASTVMPKRYSQRSSTPERRKTYRDLQSSSSEDFFLDLHDD